MADIWTWQKRSEVMARVKSHGNSSTELKLIGLLRLAGIKGWRRKQALIGKPDFVFRKNRVAVFVDGCFWHGCPIHGHIPKSRPEFWVPKLSANKVRDQKVTQELRDNGWKVLRIWECDLAKSRWTGTLRRIAEVVDPQRNESNEAVSRL